MLPVVSEPSQPPRMSWWSSLVSWIPPPADTIKTLPTRTEPKRLLEDIAAPSVLVPPIPSTEEIQIKGRRRNQTIFFAGLGFIALATLATRRSLTRRRLASQAKFFTDQPGHHAQQSQQVSGALEAVEALNIATINVLAYAMTATGAALWYLDINDLTDARKLIRGGLGVDGTGRTEEEANEEIEEVIASILARKDEKAGRSRRDG